jgi:phosphatidylinositol alpha-mannosyltransferase
VLWKGIDAERFEAASPWPTDGPTLLFVGRHERRKGLPVLLEAFESVRRAHKAGWPAGSGGVRPPTLWVAGEGSQTRDLRARYPESGQLRWLGRLSDEEVAQRMRGADVLCAPSLGGESFGVVLLEAMAARAVVVASDLPGYRDAAGGHAHLVAPGDSAALATALLQSIEDATTGRGRSEPGSLESAAKAASERSMTALADRYARAYLEVVAG